MTLKEKLLSLNLVVDNEYLDKYCELIESNKDTKREKFKTQKHHIIPKYYYKYNNLEVDNSVSNSVNLSHNNHLLAHLLLLKCSSNTKYKNANLFSINKVFYGIEVNSDYELHYEDTYLYDLVNEYGENYQKLKENIYKQLSELNKNSHTTKGKIWIKNVLLNKEIVIIPTEYESYSYKGWEKGRLTKSQEVKDKISNSLKEKYKDDNFKQTHLQNNQKGIYCWVHLNGFAKRIKINEQQHYLNNGWDVGRGSSSPETILNLKKSHLGLPSNVKGRKKINNGEQMKTVKIEELDYYLTRGWHLGELPKSQEWLNKIAKSNSKKKV